MNPIVPQGTPVNLNIVGGNTFGQHNKVSAAQTFNMYMTMDKKNKKMWLTPTSGFKIAAEISEQQVGRTIFASQRLKNMITVIGNAVYGLRPAAAGTDTLLPYFIGNINTSVGDVFIDENIAGQIAICDKQALWIYNWQIPSDPALIQAELPINGLGLPIQPGYVTYQDGYFIVPDVTTAQWFLSAPNNGLDWNWSATSGPVNAAIQTKPTNAVACLRAPGRGNLLYVFGGTVVELWTDNAARIFPYTRSTAVSLDYGCLSANTISAMDTVVAWLGVNERSGPVIMMSAGSESTKISDDGIDYRLASLNNPAQSFGFFFKQNGHLFYQITFSDPSDNFSLLYDFNTQEFFWPTDEFMNYHPAESVAFFNNSYYFPSINDGNIYRMSTDLNSYDYRTPAEPDRKYTIPCVRVCDTVRMEDNSRFKVAALTFVMTQGNDLNYPMNQIAFLSEQDGTILTEEDGRWLQTEQVINNYQPKFSLCVSRDGGNYFGNEVQKDLNPYGKTENRILMTNLGSGNEFTPKFRFSTNSRFYVGEGELIVNRFT
jgi:hypothetical protein